ncbi:MAG TPA: hypothetical protein PLU17_09705 [Chitinophagaceae bacterium]|nr:hypothetical protein [Chitinophagaceae bacterium]
MKKKSILLYVSFMLGISSITFGQQSTSGYILFGKNRDANVVCTQQGICKLQQAYEPEYLEAKFIVTKKAESEEYQISIVVNLDSIRVKQPEQYPLFYNTNEPYIIRDKWVIPKWLLTAWGFESSKNRNLTVPAGFSFGVPPPAGEGGFIDLKIDKLIKIIE